MENGGRKKIIDASIKVSNLCESPCVVGHSKPLILNLKIFWMKTRRDILRSSCIMVIDKRDDGGYGTYQVDASATFISRLHEQLKMG